MKNICVNRTNKTVSVTKNSDGSGGKIGSITPNHVFAWTGEDHRAGLNTYQVYFNGQYGFVDSDKHSDIFTDIKNFALYSIPMEGVNCSVFRTRRTVNMFNASGAYVGQLPAGSYIGTSDAACGSSKPNLISADFCGQYDPEFRDMFIDTGLNSYSSITNFNLITSLE